MRTQNLMALGAILIIGLGACSSTKVLNKDDGRVSVIHEESTFIGGVIPTLTKRVATFDFLCTPGCNPVEPEEKEEMK